MINREKILAATSKAKSEYDGFSRSTQLLVIIGFAGLLLLGVAETWRMSDDIRQETAALVEQINRTSNAKSNLRPAFRNQVQALGSMRLPDRKLSTLAAERNIFNSLNEILKSYKAEMISIDLSPGANLPMSAAPGIKRGPGEKLAKIIGRIEFDCAEDVATKVVSEIEDNPEIYSISRLQISRYNSGQEEFRRLVNVDITLESWVMKSTLGRRGR
ncbi:MAG: hypothetical protein CMJ33_07455 [Phycisphaerae bacterium]|nr:hypothetical protein [Phycisphaerae bacterium]HAW95974.1 hypothetical protein [Phycisphaerales bacterium]|tara:strand:- start:467 stop:1114 length:648 start_codon:yes stop_codon:yes gene_type:complete